MNLTSLAFKHGFKVFLILLMVGFVSACQTTRPKSYSCTLPSGFNVDDAFADANSDLAHWQCHYQFEQYMDRLLEIAASDPKPENKKQFSNFFAEARENGVLSQLQAQQYYRRYFTPDFVSLGTMHNNCSTTCRDQAETIKQMKTELRDKHRGLLTVANDNSAYAQADQEFNHLLTLIDGTCLACRESE